MLHGSKKLPRRQASFHRFLVLTKEVIAVILTTRPLKITRSAHEITPFRQTPIPGDYIDLFTHPLAYRPLHCNHPYLSCLRSTSRGRLGKAEPWRPSPRDSRRTPHRDRSRPHLASHPPALAARPTDVTLPQGARCTSFAPATFTVSGLFLSYTPCVQRQPGHFFRLAKTGPCC